mgnify:CR=1 FL=1
MVKKYCIWNNKGGVGKTFLSYLIATEYAKLHPEEDVIVVDMCPQSNISEMLLGGDGKGQANLEKLFDEGLTIAKYIENRYKKGKDSLLGTETSFFVNVREFNKKLPTNLILVPGDINLDICSILISEWGNSSLRLAWKKSRFVLNELLQSYIQNSNQDRKKTIFIDCNPSFSPYTELAIVASDRLIVPCTADHASIRGLSNVFRLLYEFNSNGDDIISFAEKAKNENIVLPKLFRIILNKSRSHDKNASKAFLAIKDSMAKKMKALRKQNPQWFVDETNDIPNIKDGNTLAAVLNYEGALLSNVTVGKHSVYGKPVQIDERQKRALMKGISDLVATL